MYDPLAQHSVAPTLEYGSVGWEDENDYYYPGTANDDGHTLVRVQLFRGRDTTKSINPTRAQGYKILCQISGGLFRVPAKDTRVLIAIPAGMETTPGAGVIVATIEPNPTSQFQNDRAVLDFGPTTHLTIRAKSVSLQDTQSPANWMCVGTPYVGGAAGIVMQAADGSGLVLQPGVASMFASTSPSNPQAGTILQMTPTQIDMRVQGGAMMSMNASQYFTYAPTNIMRGFCYVGMTPPTVATPALYGLTGIAGVASTSVFLSI